MKKTRPIEELKPGDLLTKMEVCRLFCKKLQISHDTYYKKIRPLLKFRNLMDPLGFPAAAIPLSERMPYEIAVGIVNMMIGNRQPDAPPQDKLKEYYYRMDSEKD